MTEIEKRLEELKPLGAGDAMCADCLSMKIEPLAVCKKCIADTPEFTEIMNRLCKVAVPNARGEPGGTNQSGADGA